MSRLKNNRYRSVKWGFLHQCGGVRSKNKQITVVVNDTTNHTLLAIPAHSHDRQYLLGRVGKLEVLCYCDLIMEHHPCSKPRLLLAPPIFFAFILEYHPLYIHQTITSPHLRFFSI
jgi:hypothetical protein